MQPKCEWPSVMDREAGSKAWDRESERSQGIWTQGASVLLLIMGRQEAIPDKPGSKI